MIWLTEISVQECVVKVYKSSDMVRVHKNNFN